MYGPRTDGLLYEIVGNLVYDHKLISMTLFGDDDASSNAVNRRREGVDLMIDGVVLVLSTGGPQIVI